MKNAEQLKEALMMLKGNLPDLLKLLDGADMEEEQDVEMEDELMADEMDFEDEGLDEEEDDFEY